MKSNVFKKAHELTKKIIKLGDSYRATFRLCLLFVYSQAKKGVIKMSSVEEKLIKAGYKVWEVGSEKNNDHKKRIYINNIAECMEKFDIVLGNPSFYKGKKMYYDCIDGKFYLTFNTENATKIDTLISKLRG